MSRSPHLPTKALREQVKALAATGVPQDDIGTIIGCSEKTLRLHYRAELDEGAAEANAAVVGFLLELIEKRNVAAMIFFDKCKGGPRENVREELIIKPQLPLFDMPCNGFTICGYRDQLDYVEGEEAWSIFFHRNQEYATPREKIENWIRGIQKAWDKYLAESK